MRQALILAVLVTVTSAHATPTEDLDRGRRSFRSGDWQSAKEVLGNLLYPRVQLVRQEETVEAHIMVGASAYQLDDRERATEEFTKALEIDIERSITTLNYSEGAVKLFEDTKAQLKIRREQAAERKRIAEQAAALQKFRDSLYVYEARPYFINFLPFGAGQFQNKQTAKIVLIGGGQLVTFGASVGIFIYLAGTYGLEAKVPLEDGPGVRRLQQIEIATGVAFLGLYAYGVIDALRNYKPNVRVKGDDSLMPPDLLGPEKPTKPKKKTTSLRERLRIGPMLTPNGAGIGIGWEND